jgi:multiple antibiotic resistance protein
MDVFSSVFIYAFVSLFSIVNPVGMSGVFLELTKRFSNKRRHIAAYLVALYGTILLITTFFIGPYVLRFFGISIASIQVAGGILVFYSAWGMLNIKPKADEEKMPGSRKADNIFFPLTMPITAGAGSIAVTITLATKVAKDPINAIQDITATIAAILLVFVTVAFSYRYADSIFEKLGRTGTSVVGSLSAFILLAIGVTVIWQGILGLVMPIILHLQS